MAAHHRSLPFILALVLAFPAIGALAEGSPPQTKEAPRHLGEEALVIDEVMRGWVRRNVPRQGTAEGRLRALAARLLGRTGLHLQEADETRTAAEMFHGKRGNCVSFALLFVALAREAGLPAFFLLSEDIEDSRWMGGLEIADRHLAAGFGEPGSRKVFDFGGKLRAEARFRRIEDPVAVAIYLSNRGAERMIEGDFGNAGPFLLEAVHTAPELALAWLNLGVILRRSGDLPAAEEAFREAIAREPQNVAAWRNLALLLEGRPGRANPDEPQLQLGSVSP